MLIPLLMHVHIPKCGGTSFRSLLKRSLGDAHLDLYVNATGCPYNEDLIEVIVKNNQAVRAISSHFIWAFPPLVDNRVMLYTTFLREPFRHFVSYLKHIRRDFHSLTQLRDSAFLKQLPQDPEAMTLEQMAEWFLTSGPGVAFRESYTVYFLTRGIQRTSVEAAHGTPNDLRLDLHLALAKAILSSFFFVGIVEEMASDLKILSTRLHQFDIWLESEAEVLNAAAPDSGDLDWDDCSRSLRERFLEKFHHDIELYAWVKSRRAARSAELLPSQVYDGKLVCGTSNAKAFYIHHGMKSWVTNVDWILARGFSWPADLVTVPERDLSDIPEGPPIS